MRETRQSGSEGGVTQPNASSLPLFHGWSMSVASSLMPPRWGWGYGVGVRGLQRCRALRAFL
jgi:hypothetical protein